MRRLILLFILATLTVGCESQQNTARSKAKASAKAQSVKQQTAKAIADADAAIAKSQEMAQQTAGVDSRVPGQPRLTDAERYRRLSLQARSQAHRYANMANKCTFLAANVEDKDEKEHWRRYAKRFAEKSNGLRALSEKYANLAKQAAK